MSTDSKQRGSVEIVIICVLVAALCGVVGWVAYQNIVKKDDTATSQVASKDKESQAQTPSTETKPAYTPVIPAGWKTVTDAQTAISYALPVDWRDVTSSITAFDSTHTLSTSGGNKITYRYLPDENTWLVQGITEEKQANHHILVEGTYPTIVYEGGDLGTSYARIGVIVGSKLYQLELLLEDPCFAKADCLAAPHPTLDSMSAAVDDVIRSIKL